MPAKNECDSAEDLHRCVVGYGGQLVVQERALAVL
jgi:hypothetical protein